LNLLKDILTYIRRIIKSPSNGEITDNLLIDYVNRFWIMDVDARIQLFDFKTKYQFQTQPGVDQYNMPLYNIQVQPGAQQIASFPVYQGFTGPAFVDGIPLNFYTERHLFQNIWPTYMQTLIGNPVGNGTAGPYTLQLPFLSNLPNPPVFPISSAIMRGHVDITGIIALNQNVDPPVDAGTGALIPLIPTTSVNSQVFFTSTAADGSNIVVQDSGVFLSGNTNYGLLMNPGKAPFGNQALVNGGALPFTYQTNQNTINYLTGVATNVYFPQAIPSGTPISVQANFYQLGIPRSVLYYNNTLTFRAPPNTQYLVEMDAYLTPAAFLTQSQAVPFGYMSEYIARGAARKILSDTGDWDQFNFYEPLFHEQESLVHIRSQRQWTSTRNQTIYANQGNFGNYNYNQSSGGV